jgi:hypothetical protein
MEFPKVSAVIPVPSETKKTVRPLGEELVIPGKMPVNGKNFNS